MHVGLLLAQLSVGGTERQFALLARALAERGHRVTLHVLFSGGGLEASAAHPRVERVVLGGPRPRRAPLALPRLARALRRSLAARRPDVLYAADYASNLLAARVAPGLGVPVVWGVRDHGTAVGWTLRALRRLGAPLRDRVALAISNSRPAVGTHRDLGYLPERAVVVPNGVDVLRFAPAPPAERVALRARLGAGEADVLVGLVARPVPVKDHGTFLRAARRALAAESRLRFVCASPDGRALPADAVASARALGDRLRLVGTGDDPRPVYRALDVLASSSRTEGFSNVLAEAMACGVPCVSTDAGDARLAVGDTGRVVPVGDAAALGDALGWIAALPAAERRGLGERARARVAGEFSVARLVERTERALAAAVRAEAAAA